ncbi:hypothetical protein ACFS4T_15510 [Pseudomonas lini]
MTFTIASPAEHTALQTNLKELLRERDYLKTLTRERNQLTHNKKTARGTRRHGRWNCRARSFGCAGS